MTRKRFIRLVMAYGIQRNEAQRMAMEANKRCRSYTEAYEAMRVGLVFRKMGNRLAKASVKLRKAATKAGEQIRKFVADANDFTGGLKNEDPGD